MHPPLRRGRGSYVATHPTVMQHVVPLLLKVWSLEPTALAPLKLGQNPSPAYSTSLCVHKMPWWSSCTLEFKKALFMCVALVWA